MSGYKDRNTPIPLDHPGKPYGGIDVSKPENYQAGNEYLAKQRAQSIINELKSKLEQAGIKGSKFTAASKILTGTFDSNELRYLKVDITAMRKTNDIQTTADIFLNFSVSYETGEGLTQDQGINKIQQKVDPANTGTINQTKTGAYKATVSISFGQKDSQLTFNNQLVAKDLASTKYDQVSFPDVPNQSGGSEINAKSTMTPIATAELYVFNGKDKVPKQLQTFLASCGRFRPEQAKQIIKDLTNIKSNLFKTLANKKGDFDQFVQLAGGLQQPEIRREYGVRQIFDKTRTPESFVSVKQ